MFTLNEVEMFFEDSAFDYALLLENKIAVTPLLREELLTGVKAFRTLRNAKVDDMELIKANIRQNAGRLVDHWNRVYRSPFGTARLIFQMNFYREFLVTSLLCDYGGRSPFQNESVAHYAAYKFSSDEEKRKTYQNTVVEPLEEMILNVEFVEGKMNSGSEEGIYGNNLDSLVKACEWEKLAVTMTKDKVLAAKLLQQGAFEDNKWKAFSNGMERIKSKYFSALLDGTRFQLTSQARSNTANLPNKSKLIEYSDS